MRVHLFDGTYELFRAFYGAPSSLAPGGREVGATRALLGSLHAFLRDQAVTHAAVAFDHVIESFRNDLYVGYKTGEGIDPALFSQFELAERAVRALGLVAWPMVEFEADDALAAFAERARADSRVEQVVIVSPDKDLTQCVVGERVVCLDRARGKTLDDAGVVAKFGVGPASIPSWLGLVGDAADGIPGVPRWGARAAAHLLSVYGTLDAIPDDVARWSVRPRGAEALAASLREHRVAAMLYLRLATLRRDVPLTESVDDLEWKGADRAVLTALCDEIGETALLGRISRFAR